MQGTKLPSSPKELAAFIDHTLLKPDALSSDIEKLCAEARTHGFKAVCVNPTHVALAHEFLNDSDVLIASVVGFPLGAHPTGIKALETVNAISSGANEIDMVARIDLIKEGNWQGVEEDIAAVVKAARGKPVKVILETGLLTANEITEASKVSERAGAAFVKTSTGFLGRGASVEDIELMRKAVSDKVEIKASGGVKTFEQALAMIRAGATRIGTSSGVALVSGTQAGAGY